MKARLKYTNSAISQKYIGQMGEIERNARNGYSFIMDNGLTINTTGVKEGTQLGSIDVKTAPESSFETMSGSTYVFENMERERAVDGVFKKDNQFLGYNKDDFDYKEINQGKEKRGYNYEINEILNHDAKFRYQLLDRMKTDCNYYLGNGNRHDKYLWAGNVTEQIQYMKDLWKSFPDDAKPEWLTWEQICEYEKSMTNDNEINIIDNSDMELDEPEI